MDASIRRVRHRRPDGCGIIPLPCRTGLPSMRPVALEAACSPTGPSPPRCKMQRAEQNAARIDPGSPLDLSLRQDSVCRMRGFGWRRKSSFPPFFGWFSAGARSEPQPAPGIRRRRSRLWHGRCFSNGDEEFRSSSDTRSVHQGWGLRLLRACGRLAPDPHSHGRTLLPGRRPQPYGFLGLGLRARWHRKGAFGRPKPGGDLTRAGVLRYFCGLAAWRPDRASGSGRRTAPCASVASIGRAPHS